MMPLLIETKGCLGCPFRGEGMDCSLEPMADWGEWDFDWDVIDGMESTPKFCPLRRGNVTVRLKP